MNGSLLDMAVKTLGERDIQVHLVEGPGDVLTKVNALIKSGPVALSGSEYIMGLGLRESLEARGIETFVTDRDRAVGAPGPDGGSPGVAGKRAGHLAGLLEGAAYGVTGATGIAADTGSVVIMEDGGNDHMVSALPHVHIVVAPAGKVAPTLANAIGFCRDQSRTALKKNLGRHISIISGPSMTADIQGVPVKGMHGPLSVHVILVK